MLSVVASTVVSASGSHTTRSASRPTAIAPFLAERPASAAGRAASQRGEPLEWNPALGGAGPDDGESELERGDAAPGFQKVAVGEMLQRRRRGRVIGRDKVDLAGSQRRPEAARDWLGNEWEART